ncbi:MAG TPA: ROK family transcriptional regulator [Actinocrinis sp.]|nr:ROK family transcriptional regulator [Actinocrinis sp.]
MTAVPGPASVSARRQRTRDQLLDVLAGHENLSRADLAQLTGLSRSAVGACVAALVDEGLATEEAPAADRPGGPGRPAAVVRLRRAEGTVLGLDFGHTHIAAAVADTSGRILAECTRTLDVDGLPQQALDAAARLARDALDRAGRTMAQVGGIAAGIPGPLDVRTRVVREPTILASWIGLDPAAELGRRLDQPVAVGNDADMGALGEHVHGAARGIDDFVYVKASHGIGAGLILAGRPYRGSNGIAGEIGHTQLPGAINWCRCGNQGCLETVVSVGAVYRRLAHVIGGEHAEDGADLPPLARLAAVPAAARVMTDAGRTIGRVLADLVNCLNPAAIILGGELGSAGEPLVAGVRESIDRHASQAGANAVTVAAGRLGPRAELLGAVVTAIRHSGVAAAGAGAGASVGAG